MFYNKEFKRKNSGGNTEQNKQQTTKLCQKSPIYETLGNEKKKEEN